MRAIVIAARGLQLSALGCYGNPWIDTPALDRLAATGIVFDQHFADCADSTGANRAWRSGRYRLPSETPAPESSSDLLDALKTRGIHTCLVVDAGGTPDDNFARGWDEVTRSVARDNETPLEAALEAAGAALERLEPRADWLLWIDLATLLPPWNVPDEYRQPYFTEETEDETEESEEFTDEEQEEPSEPLTPMTEVPVGVIDPEDDYLYLSMQTSYATAVCYLDAAIEQLLEALAGLQGGEDVLLIVTTDVGQNLGEHGVVGPCRAWLHEELIHLPLLLCLPNGEEAGRRVEAITQTVDLAPTLADWFQSAPLDAHGHSLLPLARGQVESIRPYACAGLRVGAALEYALRTPEWAFLLPACVPADQEPRTPQLYVKPDDRAEVNSVVQHHLEFADKLERTLRDFVTAACQPGTLHVPALPEHNGPQEPVSDVPLAERASE